MRIGLVLDGTTVDRGGAALRATAARAEEWGWDLLWLRQDDRLVDPFLAATAVAAATSGVRIGVEVALGDTHPVVVAEQAAVCDLAVGGRLVLGLRAAEGADADLAEAVGLVVRSHRSLPFRSDGPRWPTPAGLEANSFTRDRTVRVTPAPAQPELPTWVVGAPDVAARFGLSPVVATVDPGTEGGATWAAVGTRMGEQALRMSRPAVVAVAVDDGRLDHRGLLDALLGARDGWGLDTALMQLPGGLEPAASDRLVADIARIVRPRVQQEQIPEGLLSWWDEELLR